MQAHIHLDNSSHTYKHIFTDRHTYLSLQFTWSFSLYERDRELSEWQKLRPHICPAVRASEQRMTLTWAHPVCIETRARSAHGRTQCPAVCSLISALLCLPIYRLLSLRVELSWSIMYCTDNGVTSNEVIPPSLSAWPALSSLLGKWARGGEGGGLTSLAHSKNKWQPTKQMWHYNWVLKGLTFTKAHLYGCPYLAHWQPPLHWVEQEAGKGWGWANTVGWAFNGLCEDRPVDEWTPGLMGSVSTKLLRKENPSQGSHFIFYFYCMSHGLFSSAGFRGGSRRVPRGQERAKKGHFLDLCTVYRTRAVGVLAL